MSGVSFVLVAAGVCVIGFLRHQIMNKNISPLLSAVSGLIVTEFMLVSLAYIKLKEGHEAFSFSDNILLLIAIHIVVPVIVAIDCYRIGLQNSSD